MKFISSPSHLLLIAAGAGLLVWNTVATANLSTRLERLENRFAPSAMSDTTLPEEEDSNASRSRQMQQTDGNSGLGNRAAVGDIGDPVAYLDNLKNSQVQIAPEQRSLEMANLLAREPSNPSQEASAQQWLQQAARDTKGENVPKPADVATSCRGQRCLTTATFANEGDARSWATRYLLTAGGSHLANSTSVLLPAQNGNSVTLQLYLY